MGHGLGGTSAIQLAKCNLQKVTQVISLDPWLFPLKDQLLSDPQQGVEGPLLSILQPHCCIVSEYFQSTEFTEDLINWKFTRALFTNSPNFGNMVALLKDCSHLVFTDLALLMLLEFRVFTYTPSIE